MASFVPMSTSKTSDQIDGVFYSFHESCLNRIIISITNFIFINKIYLKAVNEKKMNLYYFSFDIATEVI